MSYKIASAGALATTAVALGQTTHVLVKGGETDSSKVIAALERGWPVHIVSERWMDACLANWSLVPEGLCAHNCTVHTLVNATDSTLQGTTR